MCMYSKAIYIFNKTKAVHIFFHHKHLLYILHTTLDLVLFILIQIFRFNGSCT